MPSRKIRRLTEKEEKFVDEYVSNGENGKQAALAAYNIDPNARTDVASTMATEVLSRPQVQDAIVSKWDRCREQFTELLSDAYIIARRLAQSGDEKERKEGMDWIKEIAKALSTNTLKSVDNRKQTIKFNSPK